MSFDAPQPALRTEGEMLRYCARKLRLMRVVRPEMTRDEARDAITWAAFVDSAERGLTMAQHDEAEAKILARFGPAWELSLKPEEGN